MFCKNCGKQINDDSQFCLYCGKKINKSLQKQITENYTNSINEKTTVLIKNDKQIMKCNYCKSDNLQLVEETCRQRNLFLEILLILTMFASIILIIIGIIKYFNITIDMDKIINFNKNFKDNVVIFERQIQEQQDTAFALLISGGVLPFVSLIVKAIYDSTARSTSRTKVVCMDCARYGYLSDYEILIKNKKNIEINEKLKHDPKTAHLFKDE